MKSKRKSSPVRSTVGAPLEDLPAKPVDETEASGVRGGLSQVAPSAISAFPPGPIFPPDPCSPAAPSTQTRPRTS